MTTDSGYSPEMLASGLQVFKCSKSLPHKGSAVVSELLLISDGAGNWQCKPRCLEHSAKDDAEIIGKVKPSVTVVIIPVEEYLTKLAGS
jgi:hypothetical protein